MRTIRAEAAGGLAGPVAQLRRRHADRDPAAILRGAFDRGVTHFDLANNYGPRYGAAERNFGQIFSQDFRPYRDELVISTKAGYDMWPGPYGEWGSRKYLLASLDQSLARMGLDHVDIFYSHRLDPETRSRRPWGRSRPPCSPGGDVRRDLVVLRRADPKAAGLLRRWGCRC